MTLDLFIFLFTDPGRMAHVQIQEPEGPEGQSQRLPVAPIMVCGCHGDPPLQSPALV